MKNKLFMPLNLQLFAEGDASGGSEVSEGNPGGAENASGGEAETNGSEGTQGSQKTFTQEEMTATATKEKREGKNSILKLFRCKDEKSAKEEAAAYLAWKESQKTEDQRNKEATEQLESDKNEAEKRATAAESKLSAFMAGVNKDSIDDVLAIAATKVSEDKNLDKVLEEMKNEPRYKGFFSPSGDGSSNSSSSTGSGVGHGSRGGSKQENIGERLAKQNLKATSRKSSYFKN